MLYLTRGYFYCYIGRYGVDLMYKRQPLIRGRGVSYCKNLLSPRFEHSEGIVMHLSCVCLLLSF